MWPPHPIRWPRGCPDRRQPRERVVSTLAVGGSDRVDGCEVEHVEAEVGDLREPAFDVAQRAVVRRRSRRSAKSSHARQIARPHGIDDHLGTVRRCGRASVGAGLHEPRELGITAATRTGCARSLAGPPHASAAGPPGPLPPYVVSTIFPSLDQLVLDVLAGIGFRGERSEPRSELIDPRFIVYSYSPICVTVNDAPQESLPSDVSGTSRQSLMTVAILQHAGQPIASVGEHVRADEERFADPLHGKRPPSICGCMRSITTRDGFRARFGSLPFRAPAISMAPERGWSVGSLRLIR